MRSAPALSFLCCAPSLIRAASTITTGGRLIVVDAVEQNASASRHSGPTISDRSLLDGILKTMGKPKTVSYGNAFWISGVVGTIIGQAFIMLGLQVQTSSHRKHTPSAAPVPGKSNSQSSSASQDDSSWYFTHSRWILGFVLWVAGHLTCWVVNGMTPQCVLACIQSLNIVLTLVLSPLILGEDTPPNACCWCSLLVCGCILVVSYGPRPQEYTMETVSALFSLLIAPESLVLCVSCFTVAVIASCTSLFNVLLTNVHQFVLLAAIWSWYATVCSRSMAMLIITSASTQQIQLKRLGFYMFVLSFAIFATVSIHNLNMALKFGLACFAIPLYEGLSIVGRIVFGGVCFREFEDFGSGDLIGFVFGVCCIIVGLIVMGCGAREDTRRDGAIGGICEVPP